MDAGSSGPDALASFSRSLDEAGSPFFQADGFSPDETWNHARLRMAELLRELARLKPEEVEVSVEYLLHVHDRIFSDLFPGDAGRFRWKHQGRWEDGPFGVGVGSGPGSDFRSLRGTAPRGIRRALHREFDRFHERVAELESSAEPVLVADATMAAGRLYARILRIHPFVDGNLRAAFVVLQATLLLLRLQAVSFDAGQEDHDRALLQAFEKGKGQSYMPIGQLIAERISEIDNE